LILKPRPDEVDIEIVVSLERLYHGSGNMTRSRACCNDSRSSDAVRRPGTR
jgi:hypothetical protein